MKLIHTLSILVAALFLVACSGETSHKASPVENPLSMPQLQQQWVLVTINKLPLEASINSTLNIDQQAQATGNLACNNFFGTLEVQDKNMRISPMGSTRKMCLELINEIEQQVMAVLMDWSEVQVNTETLTLIGKEHQLSYQIKQ